ncbi:Uncharacterised protein [Delftia tsuruhatensis]|uniref:hypothetical protein n=1 Tax=Delftia tsuruhatensis TaxID=180282 RepID=UPI001E7367DE|nr:hypothetical protein [Delftia tsuruhatensis]CAB5716963.1 Uncharacterised protein [Delftia tsuruhatensis]CAC9683954.1 Uncharacterised protein [Delftia tsuruhatensis]
MSFPPPDRTATAPAPWQAPRAVVWRRGWLLAWLLVCSLALAPLLGQMHRVVHAGGLAAATLHRPAQVEAEAACASCTAPIDWVHALFSGHGPADCQLLDQLHDGMAGPPSAVVLPPVWAEQARPMPPAMVRDGRTLAAFFDARAPPHCAPARLAA